MCVSGACATSKTNSLGIAQAPRTKIKYVVVGCGRGGDGWRVLALYLSDVVVGAVGVVGIVVGGVVLVVLLMRRWR
jgi:hypothetical protein